MKKNFNQNITSAILLSLAITMGSCTKDFKELNTNPNAIAYATPQSLLAPALTEMVSANMNRSQRVNNELMQVTVNMGDTEGKIFRYEVRTSEADYLWNSWYIQLSNFKDIYTGGEANLNSSYKAVSLICQAWTYSLLTDTYGDVPFSQSNQGKDGELTPKFDQQKDIYDGIFQMLENANGLLKEANNAGNAIAANSDPVFSGSREKWRKFGNSLFLRLLLRASGKSDLPVTQKIKEMVETKPAEYPIMASNDDSAILRWTGVAPYVSPFATWREADWYGPKLASFFVDNLNEWSDPRIQKWGSLYQGEYEGIPSGYAPGQAPEGKSSLITTLRSHPLLGNIMNYGELQLILAEAALKGWISIAPAKNYYETGATSGITLWGATIPANYLTFEKVKWDDGYTTDQKMELIHLQKYYAMFFTDLQQWFEYRRSGYPNLPKGAGLGNNKVMPARLTYPVYVQSANGENYRAAVAAQGPDLISTEMWWQKP